MGASDCKACGYSGRDGGLSMDFGRQPKAPYRPYAEGLDDPLGEQVVDQLMAGRAPGSEGSNLGPRSGYSSEDLAKGRMAMHMAGSYVHAQSSELSNAGAAAESNWVSYFGREDAELPTLEHGPMERSRRRHTFETCAVYDGEWRGNERSGFGVQVWPDGAIYEGHWDSNKANGRGRFTHCDGDVYVGEWRNNVAHGQGIYLHRGGTTYSGDFRHDLQDGYGVETWEDQSSFEGEFVKGRKNGHGVYHWPDRSEYAGQWRNNSIDGCGTYVGSDGRTFRGCWRESHMHGCGKYSWPDGKAYEGQYVQDQKDGLGIFTWPCGRRYEGYWWQGSQHGLGRIYTQTQGPTQRVETRLAEWQSGERVRWLELDLEPVVEPGDALPTGMQQLWP